MANADDILGLGISIAVLGAATSFVGKLAEKSKNNDLMNWFK